LEKREENQSQNVFVRAALRGPVSNLPSNEVVHANGEITSVGRIGVLVVASRVMGVVPFATLSVTQSP